MKWVVRHRWALIGWSLWAAGVVVTFVIPPEDARAYATLWVAALTVVSVVLTVGFWTLSKPTKNADGKREWLGEWLWFATLPAMVVLMSGNSLISRLRLSPQPPTPAYVQAQQQAAIVTMSVFALMLWLTVLWVRRQIKARRRAPDAAQH